MPHILEFDFAEVEILMDHAEKATEWTMGYQSADCPPDMPGYIKPGPALLLVKDEGIYLCSNGLPHLPSVNGRPGQRVAYATGYSPLLGDLTALWHRTHTVSGDDFVEVLPWIEALRSRRRARPDDRSIRIIVQPNSIELQADLLPPRKKVAHGAH